MPNFKKYTFILLLCILAIAAFFRLWQLTEIPPGIWPDEAQNAVDAINALETKEFKAFYPDNNGREGLFINLNALLFALLGISIFAFKILPATIGILTVLGQFLFVKEFVEVIKKKTPLKTLHSEFIALLSSFFLAISFWHVNFSRIDFRAIMTPFILVFSFYFLFKAFRTKTLLNFILAGLVFGVGLNTYISFRFAIPLLGFILLAWLFYAIYERWWKKYLLYAVFLGIAAILSASPMLLHFLNHPEDLYSRSAGISVFKQEQPIKALGESLGRHLAMFNGPGDANWRHNYSGSPQLSIPVGIFFLLGIAWGIKHSWKSLRAWFSAKNTLEKQENTGIFFLSKFTFAWFFLLLSPGVLTYESIPHALRVIGVMPVVYLFAGVGAYFLFSVLYEKLFSRFSPVIFKLILAVFLLASVFSSFSLYFLSWAKLPQVKEAFTQRFVETGYVLNSLPNNAMKYVVASEGDLPTKVSMFISAIGDTRNVTYLSLEQFKVETKISSGDYIVMMNKDENVTKVIKERFPWSNQQEFTHVFLFQVH